MALHIAPGTSKPDRSELERAASEERKTTWVVPKRAVPGDEILFLIEPDGLFARGVVASEPSREHSFLEHWPGRYGAEVEQVALLDPPIPTKLLVERFPAWGWPTYPRNYVTVPAEVADGIADLVGAGASGATSPASGGAETLLPLDRRALPVVLGLIADVIEMAAAAHPERWGVTYWDSQQIRVNCGWTEILTAGPEGLRLVVDGRSLKGITLPGSVILEKGRSGESYYPSIRGSVLVAVPYRPVSDLAEVASKLRDPLKSAVAIAAKRSAGRGVVAGHNQWAVEEIARAVGRSLPAPRRLESKSTAATKEVPGLEAMEGALRRVVVSRHERSATARAACIRHHGCECAVCGFSFERAFGPAGRGFIHVHHLEALAGKGGRYRVDPVRDLRPVCPNCHAMIHRTDPPTSIAELRSLRCGARG